VTVGHPWFLIGTVFVMVIVAACIAIFIRVSGAPARAVVLQCEYVAPDGTECVHTLSQHGNDGPCHGRVQKMTPDGLGAWVPCGCPAYIGPVVD